MLRELALSQQAVAKRRQLSEDSFRIWLVEQIQSISARLGFVVQNIAEFAMDVVDGWKSGYRDGRQAARERSIRARKKRR